MHNSNDLLARDDKGESNTRLPLTRLFRRILRDTNMTPIRWSNLANEWFKRKESGLTDTRQISQSRFNLTRGVLSDTLTAANFIEGICCIHQDKKAVVISVETLDDKGMWTRTSVNLNIRLGGIVTADNISSTEIDTTEQTTIDLVIKEDTDVRS
jgi:hypothetical protein